eukprot:1154562-Pelagomonas_calceolata.AAC.5
MSCQERSTRPRLASLSPAKALSSKDSLPYDTPYMGAVAEEKPCQLADTQGIQNNWMAFKAAAGEEEGH